MSLHPAEHRALRELHATARQLARHWSRLATRLGAGPAPLLRDGADAAHELLRELEPRTAALGIHGLPAAQGAGRSLAGLRMAGDVLLERNQALRGALLDLHHVITLVIWLAALADRRSDTTLAGWLRGWETRLSPLEERGRDAVVALASEPDAAIEPAEPGMLGRAGASVSNAFGTMGEAFDQSPLGRMARRRAD